MFALHERTSRHLCRAGFVLLCAVPTAALLGWIVYAQSGGRARAYARELGHELRLGVSLGAVSDPTPATTALKDFALFDLETGREIVRSRLVELRRSDGKLTIYVTQPTVSAAGPDLLWALLEHTLRKRHLPPIEVRAQGETTLKLVNCELTLADLVAEVAPNSKDASAALEFHLPDVAKGDPVRLRVEASGEPVRYISRLKLDTGGAMLPCTLMATFWPPAQCVGPSAGFHGSFEATSSGTSWQGSLQGSVSAMDLDRLITEQFPHMLSGTASVVVEQATFADGRLIAGAAGITAGPGHVSRSLLAAATTNLGCGANAEPGSAADPVDYRQIAFVAKLDDKGFSLSALAGAGGIVAADQNGMLLREPPRQPQPVTNLVLALCGQTGLMVPASHQAAQMLRVLPILDAMRGKPNSAGLPEARMSRRP